jgi:uroporphyrin-3 C-methyltransferase
MAARLREVESSRSGDWVVAEAQYLVRLANQKLLIGTDIAGAVELLGDADTLLFQLGYPEARRAREALANDMVRLEQVPELDYQGIYFRLSSLIALVNDLPFPPIQSLGVDENLSGAGLDQMGWRRWWQALVSRLQPFFIIRRDAEAGFMMTNEQLELQKLRIQILLHEAQLGLMSTEQEIYRESLDRAAQLVEENFGATADATTLVTQIRALAAREVRLDVPDITASLRAVQDLGDSLRANPPAAAGN